VGDTVSAAVTAIVGLTTAPLLRVRDRERECDMGVRVGVMDGDVVGAASSYSGM
jgi:hypothetical protein